MKLIVFTTTGNRKQDSGGFGNKKFSATKPDASSGTFTVMNVEPADKGSCFCAVSAHSETDILKA